MIINSFVNSNILFGNNTKNTKKYYPLNNGNDLFIKTTRDDRIKNDVEYNKILEKIYSYTDESGKSLYNYEKNIADYPKATKIDEGLLLYAGSSDIHDDINRYLSNRPLKKINPKMAKEVVDVIDYSLDKLDKKYGKFSGIVYRQGIIRPDNNQYISTTTIPDIAATLYGGICILNDLDFAIIKAKNGHKINEFQREMESDYAEDEEEILLPRTSKFNEIKFPQGNLLKEKNNFIKILEQYGHKKINPSRVKVYEEI